jgi:hypothetical protein
MFDRLWLKSNRLTLLSRDLSNSKIFYSLQGEVDPALKELLFSIQKALEQTPIFLTTVIKGKGISGAAKETKKKIQGELCQRRDKSILLS